jgi:hypothetical protein
MPAPDKCEPQIINALKKAGMRVVKRNFALQMGKFGHYVYADLKLSDIKTGKQIIVVEVKCFLNLNALLDEFYRAIGQYQTYRDALELNKLDFPLYLAVPADIYDELMSETIFKGLLEKLFVKRIIVDIAKEEIVKWLD